jgi:hypothetical protein
MGHLLQGFFRRGEGHERFGICPYDLEAEPMVPDGLNLPREK